MERPNTETLLGNKGRVNTKKRNTKRLKRDEQTQNECRHTNIKMRKTVDKSSTRNVRKEKSKLKLFICVRKDSKY